MVNRTRRTLSLLALLLVLAAPLAAQRGPELAWAFPSLFSLAWERLSTLFSSWAAPETGDGRGAADPDGSTTTTDGRGACDPDGRTVCGT